MHDELSGVALQIYGCYKHGLLNYITPLDSVTSRFDWDGSARVPLWAQKSTAWTEGCADRRPCMPYAHSALFRPNVSRIKVIVYYYTNMLRY